MEEINIKCPKCGSNYIAIERKLNGDCICMMCTHNWKRNYETKTQTKIEIKCPKCGSIMNEENTKILPSNHESCKTCGLTWRIISNKIEVKFVKTHPDAILPTKANESDTGYDVYAVEDTFLPAKGSAKVNCGLKVGYITPGYWFSSRSRSGLAFKNDVVSFHGTVDRDYRGELGLKLFNFSDNDYLIKKGERVCQIAIQPVYHAEMSFVDSVQDETSRRQNGFGSSGK